MPGCINIKLEQSSHLVKGICQLGLYGRYLTTLTVFSWDRLQQRQPPPLLLSNIQSAGSVYLCSASWVIPNGPIDAGNCMPQKRIMLVISNFRHSSSLSLYTHWPFFFIFSHLKMHQQRRSLNCTVPTSPVESDPYTYFTEAIIWLSIWTVWIQTDPQWLCSPKQSTKEGSVHM